jgi:hypothetical protein
VGVYLFLGLGAGATYEVSATSSGFTIAKRMDIMLRVSGEVRIDLTLNVGEARESVSVTAAAPLVQTESGRGVVRREQAGHSGTAERRRQLQNLALIGPRRIGADRILIDAELLLQQESQHAEAGFVRQGLQRTNATEPVMIR